MEFGRSAYRRHSEQTSLLLGQLFEKFREEGLAVSYTMEDFIHDYIKENLPKLTPEEQQDVLQTLPPEARLAGLSPEARLAGLPPEARLAGLSEAQVRQLLDELTAGRASQPRPPRPKRRPEGRSPGAPGGKKPKKMGS